MTVRLILGPAFGVLALLSLGAALIVNIAVTAADAKDRIDQERFK